MMLCSAGEQPGCPQGQVGTRCLLSLGSHTSHWKLAPKRDLVERGWGCWVCAAGGTSQGWVGTPGTVFCSVFQHRRWNSNLLSDILVKQMESTLPVNLQGKGLWEQPLHMSFPPWFFLHA